MKVRDFSNQIANQHLLSEMHNGVKLHGQLSNYITSKNRRDNGRDEKEICRLFDECSWSRSDLSTMNSVIVDISTQYVETKTHYLLVCENIHSPYPHY